MPKSIVRLSAPRIPARCCCRFPHSSPTRTLCRILSSARSPSFALLLVGTPPRPRGGFHDNGVIHVQLTAGETAVPSRESTEHFSEGVKAQPGHFETVNLADRFMTEGRGWEGERKVVR